MPFIMSQSWTKEFGTLSEKTFLGSTMALVGVSIVFILLVVIVFSIFLMSAVVNRRKKKQIDSELLTGDAMKADAAETAIIASDDSELVAVITAAIEMMRSTAGVSGAPYPGFKVRSIKRTRFYNMDSEL